MDPLKIFLLQNPRFEWRGQEVLQELNTKAKGLLFYLASKEGITVSRDFLSEMFWPEQSQDKSRSNLRQALSAIRRQIGQIGLEIELVHSEKGGLSIAADGSCFVDVNCFYDRVQKAALCKGDEKKELLKTAAELYETGFLEGFYMKGGTAAEEWILFEREHIASHFASACKELAVLLEESGELQQAISTLIKLLKTNPLQEDVHRELMRLYHKNKERYHAIHQYQQCVKILRSELNLSPMEETTRLYKQLLLVEERRAEPVRPEKALPSAKEVKRKGNIRLLEDSPELIQRELEGENSQIVYEIYTGLPQVEYLGCLEIARCLKIDLESFMTSLGTQPAESFEAEVIYYLKQRIAEKWKEKTFMLLLRRFEELDVRTCHLILYLAANPESEVPLILTFKDELKLAEVFEQLNNMPKPFE